MAPERMRNGCPSSRKSLSPMVKDEPFAGAGRRRAFQPFTLPVANPDCQ